MVMATAMATNIYIGKILTHFIAVYIASFMYHRYRFASVVFLVPYLFALNDAFPIPTGSLYHAATLGVHAPDTIIGAVAYRYKFM